MTVKKWIVNLSEEERETLREIIKKGKAGGRKINRAHILLLADEGQTDEAIAAGLHTGLSTVGRTRQRCVEGGIEHAPSSGSGQALSEKTRPKRGTKLDAKGRAILVATACSKPPDGRATWTMQLLADRLVELKIAERISDETVRTALKKDDLKPWQKEQWCIPEVSSEFVSRMDAKRVLDVYGQPYDPACPVVTFDECPVQLISETRQPIPAQPGQLERSD